MFVCALGLVWEFRRPWFQGNLGIVDPGRVIRSAQPTSQLAQWVKDFQLKSILNLRGGSPADWWYEAEVRTARESGLSFYDLPLSATRRPGSARAAAIDRRPAAVSLSSVDPLQIGGRPHRAGFGTVPHARARRTPGAGREGLFHRVRPCPARRYGAPARAARRIRRLAQGQWASPHARAVSRLGQERLPIGRPSVRPTSLPDGPRGSAAPAGAHVRRHCSRSAEYE